MIKYDPRCSLCWLGYPCESLDKHWERIAKAEVWDKVCKQQGRWIPRDSKEVNLAAKDWIKLNLA
jgi:hypothetical protein